jgi:hypothetical protein
MNEIFEKIKTELLFAMEKYPEFNSLHEAYAIIFEEVDELWEIVKTKQGKRIQKDCNKELIQIASMAIRAIIDCGKDGFQK